MAKHSFKIRRKLGGLPGLLETTLREEGLWSDSFPPDEAFESDQAFFADTMDISLWLQFVFLPRLTEIIANDADLPSDSNIFEYAESVTDNPALLAIVSCIDGVVVEASRAENGKTSETKALAFIEELLELA